MKSRHGSQTLINVPRAASAAAAPLDNECEGEREREKLEQPGDR